MEEEKREKFEEALKLYRTLDKDNLKKAKDICKKENFPDLLKIINLSLKMKKRSSSRSKKTVSSRTPTSVNGIH